MKRRHLSLRIENELYEKLTECASIMSVSVSDITRWLIKKHVDQETEKIKRINSL